MSRPVAWLRDLEAEVLTGPKGKAVRYYFEHGRCIASTIKALGFPARGSLRVWIYKLHPELHTRVIGRSDGEHARQR